MCECLQNCTKAYRNSYYTCQPSDSTSTRRTVILRAIIVTIAYGYYWTSPMSLRKPYNIHTFIDNGNLQRNSPRQQSCMKLDQMIQPNRGRYEEHLKCVKRFFNIVVRGISRCVALSRLPFVHGLGGSCSAHVVICTGLQNPSNSLHETATRNLQRRFSIIINSTITKRVATEAAACSSSRHQ